MTINSRRKGAAGENELAKLLSDSLGIEVKRILGQARDSGHDINLLPFAVEVKRRKKIAGLYEWIAQADPVRVAGDETPSRIPTLMLRADGKEWLVVMRLPDWIQVAREEISTN